MDEKKNGERDFHEGQADSSQNDYKRRKQAGKKTTLIVNDFNPNDDTTCGERIASFLVAADFTNKDEDSKHCNKEGFHPSRPIMWTRGKYKSRDGKSQSSQNKQFYSDMVVRRSGNDLTTAKNDGGFVHRTKNQRSTLQQSSEANITDPSSREEYGVEKKKTISHKRCFQSIDASTSKDEKYNAHFSCSDRVAIPRMKSEREDISSMEKKRTNDFKVPSPEDWKCSQDENPEKGHFKATTASRKERFHVVESKKKIISSSKVAEKEFKDSERSLPVNESRKSAKVRGTVKEPGGKKVAKTTSSNIDKDELKSKSENHVSAAFTGHLPGRIPGTYSLIDIEKLKQKHSRCCRECLDARAKSARPVRKVHKQEDTKTLACPKPTVPVVVDVDGSTSEEQLESSIVFFRNALTAVDLLERLFQNIGSTKEFLQNVYNGLEESSDVARCRRNIADARLGDEGVVQPKNVPKNESKEKVTSENHEDESKKAVGKPKRKDHSKIKFKGSGATGQSSDTTSLKQDHKSKTKRDRNKNLLELSDEWKKRNHNVKP